MNRGKEKQEEKVGGKGGGTDRRRGGKTAIVMAKLRIFEM